MNTIGEELKEARILASVNLDEVCEVCRCYKFVDEKTYNAAVKRYRDMRSKIIRFCRHQQNNAK